MSYFLGINTIKSFLISYLLDVNLNTVLQYPDISCGKIYISTTGISDGFRKEYCLSVKSCRFEMLNRIDELLGVGGPIYVHAVDFWGKKYWGDRPDVFA